jgi:prophage regulatory protein
MQPPRSIDDGSNLPATGQTIHMEQLVDIATIVRASGIAERTIWRMIRKGTFPAPLRVGYRRKWRAREYNRWVEQEAAKRPEEGRPFWQ